MSDRDLIFIQLERANYNLLLDSLELLNDLILDYVSLPESLADRVWCEVDCLIKNIREVSYNV